MDTSVMSFRSLTTNYVPKISLVFFSAQKLFLPTNKTEAIMQIGAIDLVIND